MTQNDSDQWWLQYKPGGGKARELAKWRARLKRFQKIANASVAEGEQENAKRLAKQASCGRPVDCAAYSRLTPWSDCYRHVLRLNHSRTPMNLVRRMSLTRRPLRRLARRQTMNRPLPPLHTAAGRLVSLRLLTNWCSCTKETILIAHDFLGLCFCLRFSPIRRCAFASMSAVLFVC